MLFEGRKVGDVVEPVTIFGGASLAFGPQLVCVLLPAAREQSQEASLGERDLVKAKEAWWPLNAVERRVR